MPPRYCRGCHRLWRLCRLVRDRRRAIQGHTHIGRGSIPGPVRCHRLMLCINRDELGGFHLSIELWSGEHHSGRLLYLFRLVYSAGGSCRTGDRDIEHAGNSH